MTLDVWPVALMTSSSPLSGDRLVSHTEKLGGVEEKGEKVYGSYSRERRVRHEVHTLDRQDVIRVISFAELQRGVARHLEIVPHAPLLDGGYRRR